MDHQPGSTVQPKKNARDRLIRLAQTHANWAFGFEDEVWWSRVAHPRLHSWAEAEAALRLQELTLAPDDPEPKALACYGLLVRRPACPTTPERMLLRFVDGRPLSAVTLDFLKWSCQSLARQRVKVWVLIWDNAAWHVSRNVRRWMREHNQQVKHTGKGRAPSGLLLAEQEPLAQPHRAQVVACQARHRRARASVVQCRVGRPGLRTFRLYSRAASDVSRKGFLILH